MGRSPELFNSGYDEYFNSINSGCYEWLIGARDYVSSAESALLREWCMRVVHEGSAREYLSGARDYGVVHEWYTVGVRILEWAHGKFQNALLSGHTVGVRILEWAHGKFENAFFSGHTVGVRIFKRVLS